MAFPIETKGINCLTYFATKNVILQETYSTKSKSKIWKNEWGGNAVFSHSESNSKGVAILFSRNSNCKILAVKRDESGRYIVCKVQVEDKVMLLCNCYGPNINDTEYWNSVCVLLLDFGEPDLAVWGGDFNLTLTKDDKKGVFNATSSTELVNNFLEENQWIDIWRYSNPDKFHFTYHRCKQKIFSCLDYLMIPIGNVNSVENCTIIPGLLSDHSFVVLEIVLEKAICGPGFWKFNNTLLLDHNFLQAMNKEIDINLQQTSNFDDTMKWEVIHNQMVNIAKDYSKFKAAQQNEENKEIESKINTLHKKLVHINLSADNAVSLIEKVNSKLDYWQMHQQKLNHLHTQGQILRSKVRWIKQGEKSTRYFLGLEKAKGKAKAMTHIINDKGLHIKDRDLILHEQKNFYTTLYTKDPKVKFTMINKNDKKLNVTQETLMNSDLTIDEISMVLKQMPSNKAPGLSGLTADFYKVFWGRIKQTLYDAYIHSKQCGRLFLTARQGVLSLLPKKLKDRKYIKNWHPISLLNIEYKILAKAFANRIKLVINDLINDDQRGFMKGRQISDNIRQMFDLLEITWLQQIPSIVVSIDFEKAFDRVDYSALFQTLN